MDDKQKLERISEILKALARGEIDYEQAYDTIKAVWES
jgi:hypothetical protein